jgi:hypothetical protein
MLPHIHTMRSLYTWEMHMMGMRLLIAFLVIIVLATHTQATERACPFCPGEKLTFQIKWSFLPAGEAVLEILPMTTINGVRAYHFLMTARTYPFIDLFYKARDRIDSYTDAEITHSILYKKRKKGKSKRDVLVNFDWQRLEAQYSNFGEKRKPISIRPGSFDPLSVFYAFRLHELRENAEIQAPVTDGKRCVVGRARIVKRETIKVAHRTYDTFLAEPHLQRIRGVFEKSKDAKFQIWITADNRRIPVKVKSKVVVGSFVAELITAENLAPDLASEKSGSHR